jgi:uncharacterized protein YciI
MQFIVIAYDGTDEKASERRLAAREAHLKLAKEMFSNGKWLYAVGILNDDGKVIGSMIVCEFASRNELKQWLKVEPYIVANVWKEIKINRAQVAPFCVDK